MEFRDKPLSHFSEWGGASEVTSGVEEVRGPPGSYLRSECNSPYYLLRAIWLYSRLGESNSNEIFVELTRLHLVIEFSDDSWRVASRVLASQGLRRLTFHVLEANAVTLLIARSLGLSLGSSVRYLEDLTSFGVLKPTVKLLRPIGVCAGRRVVVYAVPGTDVKLVETACDLHRRLENPLYQRALGIAEMILQGVGSQGATSYGDILQSVKESGAASNVPSVAGEVTKILVQRGVKVWR